MFTIRFKTLAYRPDWLITIRNSVDGWDIDVPGVYEDDEWRFTLPEAQYQPGIAFKFVLEKTYWMTGGDLFLTPEAGGDYMFTEQGIVFPPLTELVVENSYVQQRFFAPSTDEGRVWDVIVIGSGIGGGILADQLADLGVDVLVLEAGSYLFPTHAANLPRQHQVGRFDKHVWGLYDDFKIINYVNASGSAFNGGQSFNLGGRSVFWGGLIPRMTWWETDLWPQPIKWFLEDGGYQRAEDLLSRAAGQSSAYHRTIKRTLQTLLPQFHHFDAPIAVHHTNIDLGTIPSGMFSTADLLTESRLTDAAPGNQHLTINLNHVVTEITTAGRTATEVIALDLIAGKRRSFKGKRIVLAAGTIESAKIAALSGLNDPNNLLGVGITDHPIFFLHFALPAASPHYSPTSASKLLLQHKDATLTAHPYNVVLELGADFNQGRYLDPDILAEHRRVKGNTMLCEIVFLFNAPLQNENRLDQPGPSFVKPVLQMQRSPAANDYVGEINDLKNAIVGQLGGEPLFGDNLDLKIADLGGVAHEVGTLRMGADGGGVVDTDLKFVAYDNLYACDLSVFPSSPAANPTLTLAALALRLADHLRSLP
jgi:choline dehydrogenase-like flavoprotein